MPTPRCVIDRAKPCLGCIAANPRECPYPYLLAEDPPPDAGLAVLRRGEHAEEAGTQG
jgi:hypothetical protein